MERKDELVAVDMSWLADAIVKDVERKAVMFRYEFRDPFIKILIGKLEKLKAGNMRTEE